MDKKASSSRRTDSKLWRSLFLLLLLALLLPVFSFASAQYEPAFTKANIGTRAAVPSGPPENYTGWWDHYGDKVYYLNGVIQTGWLTLEDGKYFIVGYFTDGDGIWGSRLSGIHVVGSRLYFFDPDNEDRLFTGGWFKYEDEWYYAFPNGVLARGLANAGGVVYYFDSLGVMKGTAEGWVQQNGKWYFYVEGIRHKGRLFYDNFEYYLDRESGEMRTGWLDIDEYTYYFYPNGKMAKQSAYIDGKMQYFDYFGAWLGNAGWSYRNGKWYYTYPGGYPAAGADHIDGVLYYFNQEHYYMQTGWIYVNERTTYYAFPSGRLAAGGIFLTDSGNAYFNSSGFFVAFAEGWKYENGAWYFYIDGQPVKDSEWLINGKYYNFDQNGKMCTGWFGNKLFYYLPSGEKVIERLYTIDGVKYYFRAYGYCDGPAEGWVPENGKWYFYIQGNKLVNTDISDNNNEYRLSEDGAMVTGWFKRYEGEPSRYYESSGARAKSKTLIIDGVSYTFDSDGKVVAPDGWFTNNGKRYYGVSGFPIEGWMELNGNRYYFNENSWEENIDDSIWGYIVPYLKTGWFEVRNTQQYYYADPTGAILTGIADAGGVMHVFDSDGLWQSSFTGWKQENSKWFYYKDGSKVTGWLNLNSVWYYMLSDGAMATGTVNAGGVMHVFDSNGVWQGVAQANNNGWVQENGKWYYYNNGVKQTGWLHLGSIWYYLLSDGEMAVGTVNAGGVMHVFDSNGVWLGAA